MYTSFAENLERSQTGIRLSERTVPRGVSELNGVVERAIALISLLSNRQGSKPM